MGRGRAKAKQTKVARELKYHSPNTDLAALQRELSGRAGTESESDVDEEYEEEDDDSASTDRESVDDDGDWAARR